MVTIYGDKDADLSLLKDRRVGTIGYGNQGRAQALNMRDSGIHVTVGNMNDNYREQAIADGFDVVAFAEASRICDVLLILIPDEVQPGVFETEIAPNLEAGNVLCFASGYNVHYQLIGPGEDIDVIMVAPRMIGKAVRDLYTDGHGYPCLVGVEHDASGKALEIALGIAKAIGATRLGAFASSFREETLIDLFAEQMLWPGINKLATVYFEKLVENGCDPDIVATELHMSGEFLEIAKAMITEGFFKQLKLHSHTSQYGQLSRADGMYTPDLAKHVDDVIEEIASGAFAREWTKEQENGLPELEKLWKKALAHPISQAEERLDELRKAVARAHL
ncbi:ketol-acid reductoisomerase [Candidatus Hydrogenedentota bacterium]